MSLFSAGQYKFIQKDGICDRKSIIFVKLTDSAHRTLNEFLKNRDTCTEIPTIEFKDESGIIELPTNFNRISPTKPCSSKFKFDVESNMAMQGRQGRFECIKHECKSEKIQKYGLLTKRLKIHAKEDVFETTKNRMAEVELDKRKVCTKKIDLEHETVNRRSKVEKSSKLRTSLRTSLTFESESVKFGTQKFTRSRNKNQNALTRLNNSVCKKSLKERLIHLLAVKPMRKIELSAAVRKDGLRDSEKALIHSTLMSIATVKDNVHHLLRHVWNDVHEDWPFYNEDEREQMKRNKTQNSILSNNIQSTTTSLSPKLPSSADRSPSRPGYMKGVDGLPTKRLRISHFSRPISIPMKLSVKKEEDSHELSPSRLTNSVDDNIEKFSPNFVSKTSKTVKSIESMTKPKKNLRCIDSVVPDESDKYDVNVSSDVVVKNDNLKPVKTYNSKMKEKKNYCESEIDKPENRFSDIRKEACNLLKVKKENCDPKTTEKTVTFPGKEDHNSEKLKEEGSNLELTKMTFPRKENSNSVKVKEENYNLEMKEETDMFAQFLADSLTRIGSSDSDETSSFTEEYVTITNVEQRRQYKNDFIEYYNEYRNANTLQLQVHEELMDLEEEIKHHENGSSEYLKLQQLIIQKQTQLMDKRFSYLRKSLMRIKKLVCEYDEKMS